MDCGTGFLSASAAKAAFHEPGVQAGVPPSMRLEAQHTQVHRHALQGSPE